MAQNLAQIIGTDDLAHKPPFAGMFSKAIFVTPTENDLQRNFRRLLNDLRLTHAAFIAETPIDQPGDDRRNVEALKKMVAA